MRTHADYATWALVSLLLVISTGKVLHLIGGAEGGRAIFGSDPRLMAAIAALELASALLLLHSQTRWLGGLLTLGSTLAFTVSGTTRLILADNRPCACLGALGRISPWQELLIVGLFLALLGLAEPALRRGR